MTGTDQLCTFCGRPMIESKVYAPGGTYHPACVEPPRGSLEAIEKKLDEILSAIRASQQPPENYYSHHSTF